MNLVIYSLLLSIAVLHGSCLQTEIFYKIRQLVHEHQHSLQARHDFIEQQTIEQPLDHFEPSQKTFEQRYWVNANYWKEKDHGPVFLYIGGEFPMSAGYIDGGMYKLLHSYFLTPDLHVTLCVGVVVNCCIGLSCQLAVCRRGTCRNRADVHNLLFWPQGEILASFL